MTSLHLGFEIGTGEAVRIPLRHMAVTGQTQEAGKTTTLEGLVSRGAADGLRAVAFITKRGERSFQRGRKIKPYFRERADWQFVAAILEATLRERLKLQRPWIIKASRNAKTLVDVQRNVRAALPKARGLPESVYTELDAYLSIVIPQIEQLPYTETLDLAPGLNIMDLGGYTSELQALVIRSVMEWVYQREEQTVVIVPEAWEFIPQKRGSPVLLAAEELIRKGAGLGNYMWLDSQDLAGVNVAIRKSVIVWLLGVQREENEVKRTLAYIPNAPKPKVEDVMQLGKGEFFVCYGKTVQRVYVQPAWMDEDEAKDVAMGVVLSRGDAPAPRRYPSAARLAEEEDEMDRQERARYEAEMVRLNDQVKRLIVELEAEQKERAYQAGVAAQRINAGQAIATLRDILIGPAPGGSPVDGVDIPRLAAEVAKLVPSSGAVYQVAPIEKLRKDYQTSEVGRILEAVSTFNGIQKDVLALLEMHSGIISQADLAARLGKGPGGWLAQHLKEMKEQGFIEVIERQGARGRLREKIAADLAHYQATDAEIDAVYGRVMAAVAGAPQATMP